MVKEGQSEVKLNWQPPRIREVRGRKGTIANCWCNPGTFAQEADRNRRKRQR